MTSIFLQVGKTIVKTIKLRRVVATSSVEEISVD